MDKAPRPNQRKVLAEVTNAERNRSRRSSKASEPVECEICKKTFATSTGLKQYWPVHTGEKLYTCGTCNKSFTFHSNLCDHMSVHSDDPLRWQCPFCEKRCRLKGNLFKHFKTHFADVQQRLQAWKEAFPAFGTPTRSTQHATGAPSTCKMFNKSIAMQSDLRDHLAVHAENVSKWQCAHCNKQFRRIDHLRRHFKVHFKDAEERSDAWEKGFSVASACTKLETAVNKSRGNARQMAVSIGEVAQSHQQERRRTVTGKRLINVQKRKPRTPISAEARVNGGTFVCTWFNQKFTRNRSLRRHAAQCFAKKLRSLKAMPRCSTPTENMLSEPDLAERDSSPGELSTRSGEVSEGEKTDEQGPPPAANSAHVISIRYRRLDGTLLTKETPVERLLAFGDFRTMFNLPEGAKVSFKKRNPIKYGRTSLWLNYDKDYQLIPFVDGRNTIEAEDSQ